MKDKFNFEKRNDILCDYCYSIICEELHEKDDKIFCSKECKYRYEREENDI